MSQFHLKPPGHQGTVNHGALSAKLPAGRRGSIQIPIMKEISILFFVSSLSIAIISCGFPDGSISIKHSQYDHYYEMTAKFNPERTTRVDKYLDQELAAGSMSFVKTEIDGNITLDDKTTFYIKKSPGYLNIKFDKEKNSEQAYAKIKSVLEGINELVR